MADKAISELVAAEQIKSTDMFVLEQDGTAKRLQGQTLLNWLTAAADGHGGISNIVKTGTDGLVDTYTITLADTTTKTFTVTNGNGLTEFGKLSTVGLVDTYQFTRSDGTYFTFAVSNGAKGDTGDASHVWIKYASQQPTVNSHSIGDNPDDWMGVYSGTAETAPTDWQAYSWYQIKGDKGDTGAPATVTGVTAEYIVSDSGTIVPSGSWSTTIPSVPQGKYLWTRSTTNFNTGDPAVSYSVTRMGIDGIGSVSSVNDKSPSDSGNVTLTAGDIQASGNASVQEELDNAVKYNTPQSLTPEQQAQARDNINAPAPYEAGDNISITGRIITTKAFPCNPNLLDNWDFGNPVNQRGQTSYTGPGHTIDRWKLYSWNVNSAAVHVVADGVRIVGTSDSPNSCELIELVQLPIPAGTVVTASILISAIVVNIGSPVLQLCKSNGDAIAGVNTLSVGLHTFTAVIPADIGDSVLIRWGQDGSSAGNGNTDITAKAVKLELGSQQTLAHQENGKLVLNETTKFGDQLAECQRYFVRIGSDSAYRIVGTGTAYGSSTCGILVPLPAEMRTVPVVSIVGQLFLRNKVGSEVACSGVALDIMGGATAYLNCTAPGLTLGASYDALLPPGSYLSFSADL